jgi:hypothetical protein
LMAIMGHNDSYDNVLRQQIDFSLFIGVLQTFGLRATQMG